jgi:TIR domain
LLANQKSPLLLHFSYAHADETILQEIESGLTMLKREGYISIWYDRFIVAGTDWHTQIHSHLDNADIIILLISQSYLDNDYCYSVEMQKAIMRVHSSDAVRVIPIIISPCDWHSAPFARLQALPKNAKPITEWKDHQAAVNDVVKGIRIAVEEIFTGNVSERLLTEKALLTIDIPEDMSQLDKEKELELVEQELKANFEKRIANEANKRIGTIRSNSNLLIAITAISLSCNLIGLFELIVYKVPWTWLIEDPNSYGLQASFDVLLVLFVVGSLYPNWRKWCWGAGAFAILTVILLILGGPHMR